jgi:hypothetical protein
LSRLDRKFTAAGDSPLELADLLSALEPNAHAGAPEWRDAIACYLSASEGWRDASPVLGGAFAKGASAKGLRGKKGQ